MIHFAGSSQAPSSYLVLEHVFTAFYSNTEACAKKLTLILENSIGNGGRGIGLRIYGRYCSFKLVKHMKLKNDLDSTIYCTGFLSPMPCAKLHQVFNVFPVPTIAGRIDILWKGFT